MYARRFSFVFLFLILALAAAGCVAPTPETVVETVVVKEEVEKVVEVEKPVEKQLVIYNSYMTESTDLLKISREYCEGLYYGLELFDQNNDLFSDVEFIKGQITGPNSFGLQIQ